MNEWMNKWINEWMNEWMNKWMNEWMNDGMLWKAYFRGGGGLVNTQWETHDIPI